MYSPNRFLITSSPEDLRPNVERRGKLPLIATCSSAQGRPAVPKGRTSLLPDSGHLEDGVVSVLRLFATAFDLNDLCWPRPQKAPTNH